MTSKRLSLLTVTAAPLVVGMFVVLFKILKIGRGYLSWFSPWLVGGVVAASLFTSVFVLLVMSRRLSSGRLREQPAAAGVISILGAVFVVEAFVAMATGSVELMTARFVGLLASDVAVVAALVAGLSLIWRRYPRVALLVSVVTSCLLLLLYTVETAFFLRTGTLGGWLLAKFLVQSYDVKGAVAEDASALHLAVLVLPQVTLAGVVVLALRRQGRAESSRAGSWSFARSAGAIAAVSVFIAVVFPTRWLPPSYQPHADSLVISVLRDMVVGSPAPEWASGRDIPLPRYSSMARAVETPGATRKNLVVVVLESTRASSAAPENREGHWMPFLDSLAAHSLVARRMYTAVPYTTEALVALFAGRFPPLNQLGSYDEIAETGWPALLGANGYATGFFTGTYLNDKRGERALLERTGFTTVVAADQLRGGETGVRTYSGVEDAAILKPALAWADSVSSGGTKPFVLAILTQSSHHPYRLPPHVELRSAGVSDRELEMYLNTLSYVDGFLRELYESFRQRGLLPSTTFIFVGDHGESFGEQGARFHGMNVWEEAIRVPFILHDPSVADSGSVNGLFQQTDLFPTAIEAAGFYLSGAGSVARSVFRDSSHSRIYVASAGSQSLALLDGDLKFVYHYRRRPMQVFEMSSASIESIDVSNKMSEDRLRAVELELLLWQDAVNRQAPAR